MPPSEKSIEQLASENAVLAARVAELEAARSVPPGEDEAARALREQQRLLFAAINNSPSVIFVKDRERRYSLINRRMSELFGWRVEDLLGKGDADLFPPEAVEAMRAKDDEALERGQPIQFEEMVPSPEGLRHFLTIKFPVYDADGSLLGVCGIATDITEQKRADLDRAALQEQVIAVQDAALRELSTPLMPLADGVLAMPLVGSIDAARADRIVATLLEGISGARAHTAILDITGVRTVDTQVANALLSAARAARMLGARVVLTGIRPEVAQTLVQLGADLGGIVTLATLQAGITYALQPR